MPVTRHLVQPTRCFLRDEPPQCTCLTLIHSLSFIPPLTPITLKCEWFMHLVVCRLNTIHTTDPKIMFLSYTCWHPDIFHLNRLKQEIMSCALFGVFPITGFAIANPCAFHIACGKILNIITTLCTTEIPH